MKEGKFKDGKLLEWIKTKGKNSLGNVLDIVGELSGKEMIEKIGESLKDDKTINPIDMEEANKLLELEVDYQKTLEIELTKRWESDNESDNKLSKTARPITLHFISALLLSYFVMGYLKVYLPSEYTSLLIVIIPTVYGGYFALREFGKHSKRKNK